jgi:hypothetical protein
MSSQRTAVWAGSIQPWSIVRVVEHGISFPIALGGASDAASTLAARFRPAISPAEEEQAQRAGQSA